MSASVSLNRFGYDTRSLRSAVVMGAVDAINPFKRERKFEWRSPCVVSSIAGLGDLFIHLPLIAGIVRECERNGLEIRVALRPNHAAIGEHLGWDVLPFDNALEDFFKNPSALRPRELLSRNQSARQRAPQLWIDLTGNAVSALAIKSAGAKNLCARITRGGASLVDHPLPHAIQENEYDNRERVARYLGCELDLAVGKKLHGEAPAGTAGKVVLCLTTAARWKNWPLENFRQLVTRFARIEFVVTGFRHEVLAEEMHTLAALLSLPNVDDGFDRFSVSELTQLVAHSRAVVSNDTSVAHIANLFGVPGAVLFGPVSPLTFAASRGLRVFHDASCPHHPCVQWKCSNQEDWCMRKIKPGEVSDYLATLPGFES